jgi:hypothetical protein
MSNKKKERIIPKLDENFHESIFFLEIQYKKTPLKEIKEKLINYYIKGVDYYTGNNQKDFSLYFQTKLLNIMKEQDHFEKTIKSKLKEEDTKAKIKEILEKANDVDLIKKNTINTDLQKQKEQFLFNLSYKKRLRRRTLKRFKTLKVMRDTKNKMSRKLSAVDSFCKKNSLEDVISPKSSNKSNNKNNTVFTKVDNTVIDLNKINTLLIMEYVKKLKHIEKMELEHVEQKTKKYSDYIQFNKQLNLLYEDLPDKNSEEAENIKSQININEEEWDKYDKESNIKDIINKDNNLKNKINVKDIPNIDKVLDAIIKKMNELVKDN